ncbi:MAG: hypothetical protein KTR16_05875 [Acidiferrobacterales bacterium]|nr:hypothetical protein [Acidiferrobacterales bacterium]
MKIRKAHCLCILFFVLSACKTTGHKAVDTAESEIETDLFWVWIEPSYAKSLNKLNESPVRYKTIAVPKQEEVTELTLRVD